MKQVIKITMIAALTATSFNYAQAQRGRNDRGGSRETNISAQRGERVNSRSMTQVRADRGNPGNNQRGERQIVANRQSTFPNAQRDVITRSPGRDNRVNVPMANRGPVERFGRNRDNQRFNSNSRYNNNNSRYNNNNTRYNNNNTRYNNNNTRYNNNYSYSNSYNNRFYRTRYNGRPWFAYGPRYRIIPRNSVSIYFGGSPYYFYNGCYYGYYGGYYEPLFPPVGLRINFLPFGFTSIFIGGYPYYYYNGIYYRRYDNNDYEVVDPPMGATVYSLPRGAKSVILNGEKMYELKGTYYKEDRNSKGDVIYTVVGKNGEINNTGSDGYNNNDATGPGAHLQTGDIVNQLPEGSKIVTINGEKLYVTPDDTYLKEESNAGAVQYRVVGVAK
jgi:hypothetical protein